MSCIKWLKQRKKSGETRFEWCAYYIVVAVILFIAIAAVIALVALGYKQHSEGQDRCEEEYRATCYRMWVPIKSSIE